MTPIYRLCDPIATYQVPECGERSDRDWVVVAYELYPDGSIYSKTPGTGRDLVAVKDAPSALLEIAEARDDTTKCDDCGTWFDSDDFGDDVRCEACHDEAFRAGALEAGIPLSVVEGKTKLSDHFSKDYIASQINPNGGAS